MRRSPLRVLALLTSSAVAVGQFPVWTQRYPFASPRGFNAGITYDTRAQRSLAFDVELTTTRTRVWSWDGHEWSIVPAQNAPSSNRLFPCFDAQRGVVVSVRVSATLETWEFANGVWTPISTSSTPVPPSQLSLFYVRSRGTVFLVGTEPSSMVSVWEYVPGVRWTLRSRTGAPSSGGGNAAYDDVRERLVLLTETGGGSTSPQTWEWDGGSWRRRFPRNSPPSRTSSAMAFDPIRGRCVMYGGSTQNPFSWEWDGDNWLLNLTAPPASTNGCMTFDSARGRMVFLGIDDATWEYFTPLQAMYTPFGTGCAGTTGTPNLAAAAGSLPWLGGTFTSTLTGLPNSPLAVPFGFTGVSRTAWLGVALPFDLAAVGAPGCSLLASVEISAQLVNNAGSAQWMFSIPTSAALLGASFFQQALVLDMGANTLGAVFSNAATATIGDR